MAGWQSKKMLTDRDLVDDIIALRKALYEAERQRDNALSVVVPMKKLIGEINEIALKLYWEAETPSVSRLAHSILKLIDPDEDGKRC